MNTLSQFFAHPVFEAVGWALLHSIWQGLLIALLVRLVLAIVPARRSTLRYGVTLGGLAALLLAGIATVWVLLPGQPAASYPVALAPVPATTTTEFSLPILYQAAAYIENQMPLILTGWIVGIVICTLRLAAGWMYISRLKRTAIPVTGYWRNVVASLSWQLGLNRAIQLSESALTGSPVVVGILKPIILVPIGMFAGLSPQQVEAVLLHELSHIRRQDFLVNLVQSLMEVVFFFNPFMWIISSMVRDEREFCCDDEVVSQYSPRMYAEALAYLETSRAAGTALSISLTGGKNNLLHRIKRFMEKSKETNPVPQWIIPVALVAIGLMSTSWLTIGHDPAEDVAMISAAAAYDMAPGIMPSDTVTPPQEKSATYSRKKIVTIDENGEPHEEIVEKFEGDEELRGLMDLDADADFDFTLDSLRLHTFAFDSMMDNQLFYYNPGPMDFHFQLAIPDSFPSPPPHHWDVDAFREEFETMFSEKFSDFYKDHEQDLQGMMDELEEKFEHFRTDTAWQETLRQNMRELERNMERIHQDMERAQRKRGKAMIHRNQVMQDHQARMLAVQHNLQANQALRQEHLALAREKMELAREKMHEQLENQRGAMVSLRKQLVRDGYLEKDEPLRSLQWSNEGMKVNGKDVKPKDVKRYEKMNDEWVK